MKEFIQYIFKNKGKLAWYTFIILFYSTMNIYVFNHREQSDWTIYHILGFFDLIALPLALYQPYKEWKDGL